MQIVIVDDEPVARRGFLQLLGATDVVVSETGDGPEAVRMIEQHAPDLILLDVQLPEYDGFEVLRRLTPPLPAVIFVTAYDSYAVRAFETNAFDYLVKPIRADRFAMAIDRVRERIRTDRTAAASIQLLIALQQRATSAANAMPVQRLRVPVNGGEILLESSEIEWIEADDYYAALHARKRRYLVRESLDALERRLDTTRFVRVHRSTMVNLAHVREVRTDARGPCLVLGSGARVPLSRRRREQVDAALRRFAG